MDEVSSALVTPNPQQEQHASDPARTLDLLRRLEGDDAEEAWQGLLMAYAPRLHTVVNLFERDVEAASACFVFICEKLAANRYRRLRQFRAGGAASFATWLTAVARRLCVDWHRKEFGRERVFRSVRCLSTLDQQVFTAYFQRRLCLHETVLALLPTFPGLTAAAAEESLARIRAALTSRQLWLLTVRRGDHPARTTQTAAVYRGRTPEEEAELGECRRALAAAVARLSPAEQLLVRLRYEEDLTLPEVARAAQLGSPETACRRLQDILRRLKQELGEKE